MNPHTHAQVNVKTKVCFRCNQKGHIRKNCNARQCWICDEIGHIQKDCPKAAAFQSFYGTAREKPDQPGQGQQMSQLLSPATSTVPPMSRPNVNIRFTEYYRSPVDNLPQIPVMLKPTKTAAAIETERKHAEKLAALEAQGLREKNGRTQNEKDVRKKDEAPQWDDTRDLIEFD